MVGGVGEGGGMCEGVRHSPGACTLGHARTLVHQRVTFPPHPPQVLPEFDEEDLVFLASAGPATQTHHEGLMQAILARVSQLAPLASHHAWERRLSDCLRCVRRFVGVKPQAQPPAAPRAAAQRNAAQVHELVEPCSQLQACPKVWSVCPPPARAWGRLLPDNLLQLAMQVPHAHPAAPSVLGAPKASPTCCMPHPLL